MLWNQSNDTLKERLESEYLRLVSPDQMGEIYKVMYIGKEKNGKFWDNNLFSGDIFPFIENTNPQVYF